MAHSHCPPTPWYLQVRSAKMVHKEDTQADCAFSLSVVSPSSCWQTPLLLGTLAGPQQCCLCLQDVDTANSREALATSDTGWNLCSCTLNRQKKRWQDVWGTFTATHTSGACSAARESSICGWKLSVFTFGTEVFASVDCSETRDPRC